MLLVRMVLVVTDVVMKEPFEVVEGTWVVLLVTSRVGGGRRGRMVLGGGRARTEEARVRSLLGLVRVVRRVLLL